MSKLVKLIKELEGIQVQTKSYLQEKAVADLADNYHVPKENQHIWNGPASGELKDVLIGGYGDTKSFDGAGPTRLVPSASYFLRLFAVTENVDLVNCFFAKSDELKHAIAQIRSHTPFCDRYRNGIHREENHVKLESGCVPKTDIKFCGLITNVHKDGWTYKGDLSLYVTDDLGYGSQYSNTLKTIEALSENYNGMIYGNKLQNSILKSKEQMNNFADGFKMNSNYKIWVLTVDNV